LGVLGGRNGAATELIRVDERTMEVRIKGEGYFSGPLGRLARELRGDDGLLQPGKSARGAGYTVELLERNEHGISALRFTFDEPPGRDGVHLFWGSRTRWAFEIQP
ncbi:hypothetical protein LCGC14_1335250, partial [marine sediment metagenome]